MESLHGNDPKELTRIAEAHVRLEEFTRTFDGSREKRSNYVIPVVFHIIHLGGPENISDEQVHDAVRILNEDFNKQNADWQNVRSDFLGLVADVGVEFRLARKDPQGNCATGITRTVSSRTNDGDQAMKNLIQWPRNRYLNVWVSVEAAGSVGYTYRPGSVANWSQADGIVVMHNYIGSIGTSSPARSRTLTHEVGHWINLAHTWGNTNDPGVQTNCNDDDGVSDTPNTIGWTSCNLGGTTCGSLDNVENYMEYSFCSKMFTIGQANRMIAALNSTTAQRNELWQPSNLSFTGVNGPGEVCKVEFTSTEQSICAGSEVTYTDVSYHNVVSRSWEFPGGDPATSSAPDPTVVYDTPGSYPVTLTVSDGSSSISNTFASYVQVLPNPGEAVPAFEGFETHADLTSSPWTVVNPHNDQTFAISTVAAYSGSKSVRLLNLAGASGRSDELISPVFDMSGATSIIINYRYAYAQRNSSNDDRLRFYVSNNCGRTWSLRQQLRGNAILSTGGIVSGNFVPSGEGQWALAELTNIGPTYHVSDFRFKFEFESNGGNNLYIDDININGTPVGIFEMSGDMTALRVVPNPAKGQAQAVFQLDRTEPVRLELLDVLGRHLGVLHDGNMAAGEHRLDLPVASMQSGLYFIRLQQGQLNRVIRFVVE